MKDDYCSYYTNSDAIKNYMISKLAIDDGDIVLEPASGEGSLIESLTKLHKSVTIDALDIDEDAITRVKERFPSVNARVTDTLMDEALDRYSDLPGEHYSKIIGNPPYGAWQDISKRKALKKKYKGHYVKETYALFLLRCLSVLQEEGKLCFIIPDTYLFTNRFTQLRKVLLTQSRIEEILIFPSKLFGEVNFSYSNLSIITLSKSLVKNPIDNIFKVIKGFKEQEDIQALAEGTMPSHLTSYEFKQSDLLENETCKLLIGDDSAISLLSDSNTTIGDVADVVTGMCTGNNHRFLRVLNHDIKGSRGFDLVNPYKIYNCTSLDGIPFVSEGYVPYMKGTPETRYISNNAWFIRWEKATIDTYKTWKKTRFQNADYYFKFGIGLPMTKSKKIKACLLNGSVFDQSIVGVFPHDEEKTLYMLAFMNSDIFNELIHISNPTANNSANYIKGIPYKEPDEATFKQIIEDTKKIIHTLESNDIDNARVIHARINAKFTEIYES